MGKFTIDDRLVWSISSGSRLVCTRSVVMSDGQAEAFTAGRIYLVESMHPIAEPAYVLLTNNQGESHKMSGDNIRQFFNR